MKKKEDREESERRGKGLLVVQGSSNNNARQMQFENLKSLFSFVAETEKEKKKKQKKQSKRNRKNVQGDCSENWESYSDRNAPAPVIDIHMRQRKKGHKHQQNSQTLALS